MCFLISYSALKKGGQRLSTLVKTGVAVEAKPPRPVVVYSLTLKNFDPPLFTLGKVKSSECWHRLGTFIYFDMSRVITCHIQK